MKYISGTKLDERIIRCDLDLGYKEGRQFGRGKSGGQVRDEHRSDYDPGRGGWGAQAQMERRREFEERYADAQDGPGAVATGGGEWKEAEAPTTTLKRARSPDDEGDSFRLVCIISFSRHALTVLPCRVFVHDWMILKPRECDLVALQVLVWTLNGPHKHAPEISSQKLQAESSSYVSVAQYNRNQMPTASVASVSSTARKRFPA